MRKIHIVGLALAAVFAFSAFSAAAAFAESEWLVSGAAVAAGEKIHVELKGKVTLIDMAAKTKIECTGGGLGVVEAGGKDVQETAEATSCTTLEGSCGSPNAKAENLPWKTQLSLVAGVFQDAITTGGAGEPGYNVTCFGIIKDVCTGPALVTGFKNLATEVESEFEEELAGEANCTVGGAKSGLLLGKFTTLALEGLTLAVS